VLKIDDRDVAQHLVLLDVLQHLAPVLARQVEVQQDQIGAGTAPVASLNMLSASTPSRAT
jgi:hypothetical protein